VRFVDADATLLGRASVVVAAAVLDG